MYPCIESKRPTYRILTFGVISLIIGLLISIAFWIQCSTPPIFDYVIKRYNESEKCIIIDGVNNRGKEKPWEFASQNNGWPTNHYISNFIITFLISSAILFSKKHEKKLNQRYYLCCIGFTVLKGVIGEIYEASIKVSAESLTHIAYGPSSAWVGYTASWIANYWTESTGDIVLSDMLQSLFASMIATLYIAFGIIKPVSILLFFKSWWMIFLRSIVFWFFLLSSFIVAGRKNYGGSYNWPIGFYCYMFIQWFFLSILWIEDRYNSRKTDKVSEKDVDWFYAFIILFMVVMWISAGNLMLPGLITSNVASVGLFLFFLSVRVGIGYDNLDYNKYILPTVF